MCGVEGSAEHLHLGEGAKYLSLAPVALCSLPEQILMGARVQVAQRNHTIIDVCTEYSSIYETQSSQSIIHCRVYNHFKAKRLYL